MRAKNGSTVEVWKNSLCVRFEFSNRKLANNFMDACLKSRSVNLAALFIRGKFLKAVFGGV